MRYSLISVFSPFFLILSHDFIIYIRFILSQLQTLQLLTSQIRSHVEYLLQTYNIFVLIMCTQKLLKSSLTHDFSYDLMMIVDSCLPFGATLYSRVNSITFAIKGAIWRILLQLPS